MDSPQKLTPYAADVRTDNAILAALGVAISPQVHRYPVKLPIPLADAALLAWSRHDVGESEKSQAVGTLARIGAMLAEHEKSTPRGTGDSTVTLRLTPQLVGLALDAAERAGNSDQSVQRAEPRPPQFINVDLELHAAVPLTSIVAELEERAYVMWHGYVRQDDYMVTAELATAHGSLVETLEGMLVLLASLSPAARVEYHGCSKRIVDIGIEAGETQPVVVLQAELITRAAALGLGITMTHYPPPWTPIIPNNQVLVP